MTALPVEIPMPSRIRLRRVKGWRLREHAPDAVVVSRPSRWGNPFAITAGADGWTVRVHADGPDALPLTRPAATEAEARTAAVHLFAAWLASDLFAAELEPRRRWILRNVHTLHGRTLACWCADADPCHASVLIKLAAEHNAALNPACDAKGAA